VPALLYFTILVLLASPEQSAPAQSGKRKKLTRDEVFNNDEDEDSNDGGPKKRKLVPLDYTELEHKPTTGPAGAAAAAATILAKPTTAEEKRKCIKNLIERIPTAKEELFAYSLDWTMVDSVSTNF
jgi:RNA-binding protein 25